MLQNTKDKIETSGIYQIQCNDCEKLKLKIRFKY